MEKIKGTIVCLCISFLAGLWPRGTLGAPSCDPLFVKSYYPSSLISGDGSAARRQQLLNQAKSLLDQLSSPSLDDSVNVPRIIAASAYDTPNNYALESLETSLLMNLVNRLNALKSNSIVAADPTSRLPIISDATFTSLVNRYQELKVLIANYLTAQDNQAVQTALDHLHNAVVRIVTGKLTNAELPNLCSKTLALNAQLKAIDAPVDVQGAVTAFIKSLTWALTGQSQVTILALCNCLNDLETSVVAVVESDAPKKVQYLLSNLVDAVNNVIVSGGDVGCNVIDVVKRYVTGINQAVQQDDITRAKKIYSSVLSFEDELYQVLIDSEPTAVVVASPDPTTISSDPRTKEDYIAEIGKLSKAIFGDRTNLIRPGVEILLNLKNPTPNTVTGDTTFDSLRKVDDLLKFVANHHKTDTTHVLELLVDLLSLQPASDIPAILDALDPVSSNENTCLPSDATAIVGSGGSFIVKEHMVPKIDDYGNVAKLLRSGTYQSFDLSTKTLWSGSYAVQDGTIQSAPDGSVYLQSSGVYNVDLPKSPVKRAGTFAVEYNADVQADENGEPQIVESGTYSLTDLAQGTVKSGDFVVVNSISKSNPDGSTEIVKTGVLSVIEPDATSTAEKPLLDSDGIYYTLHDRTSKTPNPAGEYGHGEYNVKNIGTGDTESGTYVISSLSKTTNRDGSIDYTKSGVFYANGVDPNVASDNSDPSKILMNCADFTITVHEDKVTDSDGRVHVVRTGRLVETDSKTGITKSGSSTVLNSITTDNPDGSTDVTDFGKITGFETTIPSTDPTSTSNSAKLLPVTKDSLQALMNSLNPGKAVQPAVVSETESASTTDSLTHGVASIFSDNTAFISSELVTPVLNADRKIIDHIRMGTTFFQNPSTQTFWAGSHETKDFSIKTLPTGQILVTKSGDLRVISPTDSSVPPIEAQFLINDVVTPEIDENGITSVGEGGSYAVIDSKTGSLQTGTFVVENIVSRPRPGGAIENIKTGFLFVDDTDASHSEMDTPMTKYDEYFYFEDLIFAEPASDGSVGRGIYSIKDPKTNEQITGNYVIEEVTTEKNSDGNTVITTEGVMHLNDPDSDSDSSSLNSIIIDGAKFLAVEEMGSVTDVDGHIGLIGKGTFTQTDPETGVTRSAHHVDILNTARIENPDGSKTARKFAGFIASDISDDSQTTSSNTAPESTSSSDNDTPQIKPATARSTTTNKVPISAQPPVDPVAIFGNGQSFIINKHLVPQRDAHGNIVNVLKSGEYSLMDPDTQIYWTGRFSVDNSLATSINQGEIDVTESGTFVVDAPNDGSSPKRPSNKVNYMFQEHVREYVDDNGDFSITDEGTYSLINPITKSSTSGTFVVENTVSKTNPDGSTVVMKSGILYVNKVCKSGRVTAITGFPVSAKPPIDPTAIVASGQSFVINKHLVPERDANGKIIRTVKSGEYSLEDPDTKTTWTGRFYVGKSPSSSPTAGETVVKEWGRYLVDSSNDGSTTTDPNKKVNYSFEEHVIESVDDKGISRSTDTGTFSLFNPITNNYANGSFVVESTNSKTHPDGTIDVTKTGKLYVDEVCTVFPTSETLLLGDRGYFLFDDHIFAARDADGNSGTGVYSINDPKNNEFTTGTYLIRDASTTTNPDGTVDSKTSGRIFVDSEHSSSPSVNSDSILAITNGAEFTFDDHLSFVTDPNGNVHTVGTGVLTQTDPSTGITRTGNYQILDMLSSDNPDGSHDTVESGIFMYTTGSGATDSSKSDLKPSDSKSNSVPCSSAELKSTLKALLASLDKSDPQISQTSSGSNSESASTTDSILSSVVEVPYSEVISANGQSLLPGDLLVVPGTNGDILVGTIQNSIDPVSFTVSTLGDFTIKIASVSRFWTIPTEKFSLRYRTLMENLLIATHPPCDS